jgi:hypothetical protein
VPAHDPHLEGDVAAFQAQLDSMEGPDVKAILSRALDNLERDMRENPAVRNKPSKASKKEPERSVRFSPGAVI